MPYVTSPYSKGSFSCVVHHFQAQVQVDPWYMEVECKSALSRRPRMNPSIHLNSCWISLLAALCYEMNLRKSSYS